MNSLKKGNLQSVTFINGDTEVKQFIEANPQFKTLNVYDTNNKRLDMRQGKDQQQSEGKNTKQKNAKEKPAEEDTPGKESR